jgi:hypothetical protein
MILFRINQRLEAMEQSMAELKAALAKSPPCPQDGGEEGKTPKFKLDDAKLQEGISNLMGYDPFGKKRSDVS